MTAKILDGKKLASLSEEEIKTEVSELLSKGINPTLATILVGNDPASETYVRMKRNTCKKVGMESIAVELPESTTTEELLATINDLNNNSNVHGILLQHPVPSQIDERKCFDAIDIEKDVDGVTCLGFGNMSMGIKAYGSCTPAGIIRLIKHYELEVQGLNAVVVGRSPILGECRCRQPTWLANQGKANTALPREGCRKDKSARLRCGDDIKCNVFNRLSEKTERGIHREMI